METWIGIDISKDSFDAAWIFENRKHHLKLENNSSGFKRLLEEVPDGSNFAMEATGEYYLNCARYLSRHSQTVSVLNPFAVKMHMQSDLKRCKSDKADAYSIAKFAAEKKSDRWICPTDAEIKLKHLDTLIDCLQKQLVQNKNVLHSMTQVCIHDDFAVSTLKKTIVALETLMEKAKAKQTEILTSTRSEEIALARSIPGIGLETAVKFFTLVGDVSRFRNSRSLLSWVGSTPRCAQSGSSVHKKGSISRMGNARLRGQFYMCAISAIKFNPECIALYERLKKSGKPSKVALTAVMNKLLRQLYAILTKRKPYVPNFFQKFS